MYETEGIGVGSIVKTSPAQKANAIVAVETKERLRYYFRIDRAFGGALVGLLAGHNTIAQVRYAFVRNRPEATRFPAKHAKRILDAVDQIRAFRKQDPWIRCASIEVGG